MKKLFTILLSAIILTAACILPVCAKSISKSREKNIEEYVGKMLSQNAYELGEIIVVFNDNVSVEDVKEIFAQAGIPTDFADKTVYLNNSFTENRKHVWFALNVTEERIFDVLVSLLSQDEKYGIKAVPNYILKADDYQNEQNDERAQTLTRTNTLDPQTTSWAFDKMEVVSAWESGFIGSSSLIVAVLDSGYNPHVDVSNVDMALARNILPSNSPTDLYDYSGHGTFILGQIAATLNGSGVNGICQAIKVVPIKITYLSDNYDTVTSVRYRKLGLEYAEQIHAAVANCSYAALYLGIEEVSYSGILVVSAGNNHMLFEDDEEEQGLLNKLPNYLIVGSSNSSDAKSSFSNYSPTYVDLFAPGSAISGIGPNGNNYIEKSGTSMAAPQVAAAAALIWSHATHLTNVEVCELLRDTVDPIASMSNQCISGGRLNIYNAVQYLYSSSRPAHSLGDVNGDRIIDAIDYAMAKAIVLGTYTPTSIESNAADVNQDNIIDAFDYQMIYAFVLQTYYFPPV